MLRARSQQYIVYNYISQETVRQCLVTLKRFSWSCASDKGSDLISAVKHVIQPLHSRRQQNLVLLIKPQKVPISGGQQGTVAGELKQNRLSRMKRAGFDVKLYFLVIG